jgi:hypothetical protein
MSTTAPTRDAPMSGKAELRVVSHSALFYWWPVWAIGYLMAIVTLWEGDLMAVVPGPEKNTKVGTVLDRSQALMRDGSKWDLEGLAVVVTKTKVDLKKEMPDPRLHVSGSKNTGVLWSIVLLLVIMITNVPLRGLWSVIVIILIVLFSVIFALIGVWDTILEVFSFLDIRINVGGYVFISTVLLILWLIAVFYFDRQIYMVFTPGQFRVKQEIGDAETAYDTTGMTVQKQRSDLFRHWFLGLGSGDLIVRTAGAQAHEFHLNNVLFVGTKVKQIEEMLRSRAVVAAPPQA